MRTTSRILAALLAVAVLGMGAMAFAADEDPLKMGAKYGKGFKLTTQDKNFSMRFFSAIQLRWTHWSVDDNVSGNAVDYSNFYMRRARLWWDGHAFDPRFKYYFHLQLEPQGGVNLHDAWVTYEFNNMAVLGVGRNKIAYGLEFLNSGFGLNFIERSVMYGETDIDNGGGFSKYPGGGTASFPLNGEDANTGFPTGGMTLFRSQGVQLSGQNKHFEYQLGVWNGRRTRATSNPDDNFLYAARVGWYPMGFINWLFSGDLDHSEKMKLGFTGSYYMESSTHTKIGTGATVARYEADDSGYAVSAVLRYRGFSADFEWAEENYDMGTIRETDGDLIGDYDFDRKGLRANLGYFIKKGKIEIVGRYAEIQRLDYKGDIDDAVDQANVSGLKLATVNGVQGLEDKIFEYTIGVNWYINEGHQHKFFVDYSQLTREFVDVPEVPNGETKVLALGNPGDQEDDRIRAMLQFKF